MDTGKATYAQLFEEFVRLVEVGTPSPIAQEASPPFSGDFVPEKLVQAIWRGQFLRGGDLRTVDGRTVEVIDPGRHQTGGPGPDFRSAHLLLQGVQQLGDIEIHVDAADWHGHGHDRDFEYNNVILHVALRASDRRSGDIRQNGHPLPRLILEGVLEPDLNGALAQARELIHEEKANDTSANTPHGLRCRHAASEFGPQKMRTLLARAADVRLEQKIQRLATLGRGQTDGQTLHMAILTAMAPPAAKTLYFLLSRRLPLAELHQAAIDVPAPELPYVYEAMLSGVAGLLPDSSGRNWDELALAHEATVRAHWSRVRGHFADRALPPTRRWFSQVRPPGFPGRRIAAYATILSRSPSEEQLGDTALRIVRAIQSTQPSTAKQWKQAAWSLANWLEVAEHPYWGNHCTWGGKPLPRAVALLGNDQAEAVALNAILPWSIARARQLADTSLELFLRDLYGQFPALSSNNITRYMENRLFGGKAPPEIPMKLERYRQGLLQMYGDCCNHAAQSGCPLLE